MSGDSDGQLNFTNRWGLEAWLKTQPREVSIVIAARAALRVAPLIGQYAGRSEPRQFADVTFSTFWAAALAWASVKYPIRANDFRGDFASVAAYYAGDTAATYSAYEAAARAAIYAAARASASAASADRAGSASASAASVESAANVSASVLWEAVNADVNMLTTQKMSPHDLASAKLWLDRSPPEWAATAWSELLGALNQPHWQPWLDWYQRRLDGSDDAEDVELLYATFPTDPRKKDPAQQNVALAAAIARLGSWGTGGKGGEDTAPPALPTPGVGPKLTVVNEKFDTVLARQEDEGPQSPRSGNLLGELREAVADFVNSFDPMSNAHGQLRKVAARYQLQVDQDTPSVDLLFALGLRFENAARAAQREISNRFEPTLEDEQQEALESVLDLHAVLIASDSEGAILLEAAARYPYKPSEDEAFKSQASPVAAAVAEAPDFATERLIDLLEQLVAQMGEGEHTERSGLLGRNTIQTMLISVSKAAILGAVGGVANQIAIHTVAGQFIIAEGTMLSDKAMAFLLNYQSELRALAASYPEGFGFVARVIDWLKSRLGV